MCVWNEEEIWRSGKIGREEIKALWKIYTPAFFKQVSSMYTFQVLEIMYTKAGCLTPDRKLITKSHPQISYQARQKSVENLEKAPESCSIWVWSAVPLQANLLGRYVTCYKNPLLLSKWMRKMGTNFKIGCIWFHPFYQW